MDSSNQGLYPNLDQEITDTQEKEFIETRLIDNNQASTIRDQTMSAQTGTLSELAMTNQALNREIQTMLAQAGTPSELALSNQVFSREEQTMSAQIGTPSELAQSNQVFSRENQTMSAQIGTPSELAQSNQVFSREKHTKSALADQNDHIEITKSTHTDEMESLESSSDLTHRQETRSESELSRNKQTQRVKKDQHEKSIQVSTTKQLFGMTLSWKNWKNKIRSNKFMYSIHQGPTFNQGKQEGRVPRVGDLLHIRLSKERIKENHLTTNNQGWVVVAVVAELGNMCFNIISTGTIYMEAAIKIEYSQAWEYWSNILDQKSRQTRIQRNLEAHHPHNQAELLNMMEFDKRKNKEMNNDHYPKFQELASMIREMEPGVNIYESMDQQALNYCQVIISGKEHGAGDASEYDNMSRNTAWREPDNKSMIIEEDDLLINVLTEIPYQDVKDRTIQRVLKLENNILGLIQQSNKAILIANISELTQTWNKINSEVREYLTQKDKLKKKLRRASETMEQRHMHETYKAILTSGYLEMREDTIVDKVLKISREAEGLANSTGMEMTTDFTPRFNTSNPIEGVQNTDKTEMIQRWLEPNLGVTEQFQIGAMDEEHLITIRNKEDKIERMREKRREKLTQSDRKFLEKVDREIEDMTMQVRNVVNLEGEFESLALDNGKQKSEPKQTSYTYETESVRTWAKDQEILDSTPQPIETDYDTSSEEERAPQLRRSRRVKRIPDKYKDFVTALPQVLNEEQSPQLSEVSIDHIHDMEEERFENKLHGLIFASCKENRAYANRITGMFLEFPRTELNRIIDNPVLFKTRMNEAERIIGLEIKPKHGLANTWTTTVLTQTRTSTGMMPQIICMAKETDQGQDEETAYAGKTDKILKARAEGDEVKTDNDIEGENSNTKLMLAQKEIEILKVNNQKLLEELSIRRDWEYEQYNQNRRMSQHQRTVQHNTQERERYDFYPQEQVRADTQIIDGAFNEPMFQCHWDGFQNISASYPQLQSAEEPDNQHPGQHQTKTGAEEKGARTKDIIGHNPKDQQPNDIQESNGETSKDSYKTDMNNLKRQDKTWKGTQECQVEQEGGSLRHKPQDGNNQDTTPFKRTQNYTFLQKSDVPGFDYNQYRFGIDQADDGRRVNNMMDYRSGISGQRKTEEGHVFYKVQGLSMDCAELKEILVENLEMASKLKHPTENSHRRLRELTKDWKELKLRKENLIGERSKLGHLTSNKLDLAIQALESEMDHANCQLKDLRLKCTTGIGADSSQESLRLISIDKLQLEKWAGPTVYEAVKKWREIFISSNCLSTSAQQFFLDKCINSLEDKTIALDIRQNVAPKDLEELIEYLLNTHGKPAKIQGILIRKHITMNKLTWPITSRNAEKNYEAIKTHLALLNSGKAMMNYLDAQHGEHQTNIMMQEGVLTKEYFIILAETLPLELQSGFKLKLSSMSAREKFLAFLDKYQSLKVETHNCATNWTTGHLNHQGQLMLATEDRGDVQNEVNKLKSKIDRLETQGTQNTTHREDIRRPDYRRQDHDYRTPVKNPAMFNKYMTKTFEELMKGDPIRFETYAGFTFKKELHDELKEIKEPRRSAIITLMGSHQGCAFCLCLIKKRGISENLVIFPHLIHYEDKDEIILSESLHWCPMLMHLNVSDRRAIFEQNLQGQYCKICLTRRIMKSSHMLPSGRCHTCEKGDQQKFKNFIRYRICTQCDVHFFFCTCGKTYNQFERIKSNYMRVLQKHLCNPTGNNCMIGAPDNRLYCLMVASKMTNHHIGGSDIQTDSRLNKCSSDKEISNIMQMLGDECMSFENPQRQN